MFLTLALAPTRSVAWLAGSPSQLLGKPLLILIRYMTLGKPHTKVTNAEHDQTLTTAFTTWIRLQVLPKGTMAKHVVDHRSTWPQTSPFSFSWNICRGKATTAQVFRTTTLVIYTINNNIKLLLKCSSVVVVHRRYLLASGPTMVIVRHQSVFYIISYNKCG